MSTSQSADSAGPPAELAASALAPSRRAKAEQRLVAAAEVVLCSTVPTQILLTVLLRAAGVPSHDPAGALLLPFVLLLGLADTVLLAALMVLITRAHGERVGELWLGSRPAGREVLVGVALIPAVFAIVIALLTAIRLLAPGLRTVPVNPLEQLATGGAIEAGLFGLVAIIAGGVREELQRAFLLRRFERHLGGAAVGVVVLSTGFGLGHWAQGLDAVVTTGVLGALWAVVYLRRRSVLAPLVSHAGFNALEVLRVAAVSG
ncbi:MAG TPA: CPBP family intramembrane glutamic endopeptidase [Vicinamibacterales bacterium]|nr:CPBP family intramembrane glutamic endopeptidase [Vicinamibacterales bacterium]